jgi:hypothetical protein
MYWIPALGLDLVILMACLALSVAVELCLLALAEAIIILRKLGQGPTSSNCPRVLKHSRDARLVKERHDGS